MAQRLIYGLWQEGEIIPRLWFSTKAAAEVAARLLYPEESEPLRYSRIYERPLLTLEDVQPAQPQTQEPRS